jgi:UDP-glucose 4-epimerase
MKMEAFYKDKVVLVTGGAGAIGRNLSERLALLGAKKVIIFDNLSSSYAWNIPDYPNILFIKGDVRNDGDLMHAFHHHPEIIFHLAAFFANQNSVDYPLINEEVNIIGLIKLLEFSSISRYVEKFVFTNSEGGAYGEKCHLPYQEEDISVELGTPYYISKLSGEAYCRYYQNQYGLPTAIARLFNSYGPGEVPGQYRNVIPNFIYWAMQGKPLPLTGDEKMGRDFVFVDDTVNGILKIGSSEKTNGESINIASGKAVNIYELAKTINFKVHNKSGFNILQQRKWDKRNVIIGDPTKASELINFHANTDFEQGLDKTILWFKQNWRKIENSAEFPPGLSTALTVSQ